MAARKKKSVSRSSKMYVDGTPLNASGAALNDVEIGLKRAQDIPLDAESSRVVQQHREQMRAKAAGERSVRWNSDPRIRYQQCGQIHPNCRVAIKQVEPHEDENIDGRPIAVLKNYDDIIKYIRETHWRGGKATYRWTCYDDSQPQWATGLIHFHYWSIMTARSCILNFMKNCQK